MLPKNFLYICLLLIIISTSCLAHQSAFSYLELKENSDNTITLILKKPLQDRNANDLKIEFSRYCYDTVPKTIEEDNGYIISNQIITCNKNGLVAPSIWISNLLENDLGVIFTYESKDHKIQNKLITSSDSRVVIESKISYLESSLTYLWLGVKHILIGADHLMFVFTLLLLVTNFKTLIQTITAFTVAHSLTLGFATLGILNFSVAYIEAMIALSIVFLARELLMPIGVKTLARTYPWAVAFMFGLLHGFGFASALANIGLGSQNIVNTLLFFNLGVELGQLMFIFVMLMVFKILQKFLSLYVEVIKKMATYIIGITAAYWFIQRSLS